MFSFVCISPFLVSPLTSQDGGNVITHEFLSLIFAHHAAVAQATIEYVEGTTIGYEDVCLPFSFGYSFSFHSY